MQFITILRHVHKQLNNELGLHGPHKYGFVRSYLACTFQYNCIVIEKPTAANHIRSRHHTPSVHVRMPIPVNQQETCSTTSCINVQSSRVVGSMHAVIRLHPPLHETDEEMVLSNDNDVMKPQYIAMSESTKSQQRSN
jgi:hypothetical protein